MREPAVTRRHFEKSVDAVGIAERRSRHSVPESFVRVTALPKMNEVR
jgi:hypothetical protein